MSSSEQEAAPSEEETGGENGDIEATTAAPESPAQTPSETPMVGKAGPVGALGDPEAKARVDAAAKAIGLSAEELVNLIVDGGLLALPPSDGITKTYTLKDLGYKLWIEMQGVLTSKRADFFRELLPQQQVALVVSLRDRGFASQTIAQTFEMNVTEVNRWWNEYADDLGAQVIGARLSTIAGNLQLVAQRAQEGAAQKDDYAALWRIQKELTQQLQSIGIVDRAIHRVEHEHTHKMDEDQKKEIQAMVELEKKQERRAEELKRIEAVEVDPVPDEVLDFGEEDYS
jgi:hypothetical protein